MSRQEKAWIKPGYLSQVFRADERRMEFDCKNQTVIQKECPVDIVFIGDSITQMWELEAYFHQYHLMILNRGIGGDRTKSFLHRFYADAIQLKPKMVMIMVGINDAWDLEFDPWKREPVRETEDVLQEALFNMEQVLKKASMEEFQTVVCSILPTNMAWTNHEAERKKYVRSYNEGMKELTCRYGLKFIDYYPYFVDRDGESLQLELSLEGLHPNVFGYDKMAEILENATSKSRVVLDEIGRGTSTFDGMSIARAVVEHISDPGKGLGCKTLFATHYHELTDLEGTIAGVKNYNIAVKKRGEDITFLRRIIRGPADDSYGIEVAKLAGLPGSVTRRAHEVLRALEASAPKNKVEQMDFDALQEYASPAVPSEMMEQLEALDVETLTPIEALNFLYELKKTLKGSLNS